MSSIIAAASAAIASSQKTIASTRFTVALPVGLARTTSFSPVAVSTFFFFGVSPASDALTISRLISFAIFASPFRIFDELYYFLSVGFFAQAFLAQVFFAVVFFAAVFSCVPFSASERSEPAREPSSELVLSLPLLPPSSPESRLP